jgi:hypothetical protein
VPTVGGFVSLDGAFQLESIATEELALHFRITAGHHPKPQEELQLWKAIRIVTAIQQ